MDTMELKHKRCFGPCMVKEWGLEAYEEEVLKLWNSINLYSMNRGINRFFGLFLTLDYVDQHIRHIEGLDSLRRWLEVTTELSNAALMRYADLTEEPFLFKAIRWSQQVSTDISMIPIEERKPFAGVEEALLLAREGSDMVVVSAANQDAMQEEWELNGLAYFVDQILSQSVGSEEYCVTELVKMGYDPQKVLVIGDSPGDLDVARACGVCFYPIMFHKEAESWKRFSEEALNKFYEGTYRGDYEDSLEKAFLDALKAE